MLAPSERTLFGTNIPSFSCAAHQRSADAALLTAVMCGIRCTRRTRCMRHFFATRSWIHASTLGPIARQPRNDHRRTMNGELAKEARGGPSCRSGGTNRNGCADRKVRSLGASKARARVMSSPLAAATGRHSRPPKLALLHDTYECAVTGALPVIADPPGERCEGHVLERPIAPVVVRPVGPSSGAGASMRAARWSPSRCSQILRESRTTLPPSSTAPGP